VLKRFLLIVAVASSFLIGYAGSTHAWPIYGRNANQGYFKGVTDDWGSDVWAGGIPTSVNTATEFINYVKAKLSRGAGTQDGVGAAFIIQTMIGSARNLPPTAAQVTDWENRVRYAESKGWIRWNRVVSYQLNSYYQGTDAGPNPVDDAFFDEGVTRSDTAIQFLDSGGVTYQIRYACANPVGTLSPLQAAPAYSLSGHSTVSDSTVVPGQVITFHHYVKNAGPDTATNVGYSAFNQSGSLVATGTGVTITAGQDKNVTNPTVTIPNNSLPGTKFCQYIHFAPLNQNGGSGNGAQVCATVIADFSLTPTVTANTTAAQQNDSITFTYKVYNTGPTPTTTTTCKPVGNTHSPGYTPLPQQDVDRTSDAGYTPPPTSCPTNFLVNVTATVATETVNVGNLSPGSRICRSLVVNPKDDTGGFRASAEACVVIAKTPYVHFLGNDVWAGGGFADVNPACNAASKITTSAHALQDGSVAGSLSEYAAFALGQITNFGSASQAIVNPAAATGKMLTFSNLNSASLGFYGAAQHCINDYVSAYNGTPITSEPSTIDVGGRPSGTWQVNGARTFHGTMPNGSQQIYLVNGDVTIDADLKYSDNYGVAADIPSLVIIATGNMNVLHTVGQMDGLFVAKNIFNTCSDAPAGNLSTNDCNQQLTVNGAVIVGNLSVLRTYGADGGDDTARKIPAEQFDFNAEMYLRSALLGNNPGTLRTVDEKDLPPRY